jgi:hypothetical protein
MKCEWLQQNLNEYLDGSLSSPEKAAAEKHLAECGICRELARRESKFAETLTRRFGEAVEKVSLDPAAQRRLAMMLEQKFCAAHERAGVSLWRRLALPFAATAAILLVVLALRPVFFASDRPRSETPPAPAYGGSQDIHAHLSYYARTYTFRREGNLVIDAFTSDERVVDGLLVKNINPSVESKKSYEN